MLAAAAGTAAAAAGTATATAAGAADSAGHRGRFGAALDEGGGGFPFEVIEQVGFLLLEELVTIDPDNPLFAVSFVGGSVCN